MDKDLETNFEKLYKKLRDKISPYIIVKYMELEIEKSNRIKEQKYVQAATLRDKVKELIDKNPILEDFNTVVRNMGSETLKQQIRNFKIYILLNE